MSEVSPSNDRPASPGVLTIDWDYYKSLLEGEDISDEEAQAFLEALWPIIVGFVDLGFGIHPLQLIHSDAGGDPIELESDLSPVVTSDASSKTQFASAANRTKRNRGSKEES